MNRGPTPRLTILLRPWLAALIAVAAAGACGADDAAPTLASFSVPKNGKHLILPITVGGRAISCMIDTGSTNGAIDAKLRPLLGAPLGTTKVDAGGRETEDYYYRAPAAQLGGLELHSKALAMAIDLDPMRRALRTDLEYVLGIDSLKPYAMRIHFAAGKLDILDADATIDPSWGAGVPLTPDESGRPWVEVSLNGKAAYFLIDTGCDRTSVEKPLLDSLLRTGAVRRTSASTKYVTMDNTVHRTPLYSVPQAAIGSAVYRGLVIDQSHHNLLGLDFLSRYDVLLHFPTNRLYLKEPLQANVAAATKARSPTTTGAMNNSRVRRR